MPQAHWFVTGRVQGVFFRKYTQETAAKLGLRGWVRNTDDERVEVFAAGEADAVEALRTWCRTKGSPKSKVTGLQEVDATEDDIKRGGEECTRAFITLK
jgi:acylphosphatase